MIIILTITKDENIEDVANYAYWNPLCESYGGLVKHVLVQCGEKSIELLEDDSTLVIEEKIRSIF